MNYEEMSDFEINKLVAELFDDHIFVRFESEDGGDLFNLNTHKTVNYCNNPNDAWPIIKENKIGLMFCSPYQAYGKKIGIDMYEFKSHNENALRACMIVFLMMNEGK